MKRELQPWRPGPETPLRVPAPAAATDRFFQAKLLHAQLQRYLHALRHRWWVLMLSLLLIGGPAVFYAWRKPPAYQSQSLMWLTSKLNLPSEGLYSQEVSSYIDTQAQLIKSPPILARAFAQVRSNYPSLQLGKGKGGATESSFELAVRSSQRSSVLELKATGPQPEATRAFLDAVMDEYGAFKRESRKRTSTDALSGITDQVREVERQIQDQQNRLERFETSNNVSFLTEHRLTAGSHLAQLSGTLSELKTERELLEILSPKEYRGLAEAGPLTHAGSILPGERVLHTTAPEGASAQQAYYQALQQLQILKARRDQFAPVLRPSHSKMVKLTQEINGLEQLLNRLQAEGDQQTLVQMNERKKALELQIQNLEGQYRMWETNAAEAGQKLSDYDRMKQDSQRLQALYDRLMSLVQTVDLNKNLDDEPLVQLAAASVAHPTLAKFQIAAAGLFLALLVGAGVFVALEFMDDRFTSAMELSLHLPAEVVGQIPRTNLGLPRGASHQLPLTTAQPAFAESFRNLRSSLLFMSGQEVPPRLVLVTSAIPKEGKTTVASNLAGILAMSGARVLLVDADFRRGYIHRLFRLRRKPGLLEVLREEVPLAEAIMPSGLPHLSVLPAGETGDYTSDVLLRYRVDRLLHTLAGSFDHVIIDSAPVLATDDAACIGPYTDGAFLVVRAAYTSSRMTQEAWARLTRRNVKVLGVIYNCAPESSDYYCHYSREYGAERETESLEVSAAAEAGEAGQTAETR